MSPPARRRPPPRARSGSYVVEFVVLLPIWLLLVLTMIDLLWLGSQITRQQAAVGSACQQTARIDPGFQDQQVADLTDAFPDRLDASLLRYGLGTCAGCSFTTQLVGAPPTRRLRCEVVRPAPPLSGYLFPTLDLTARREVVLTWHPPVAP